MKKVIVQAVIVVDDKGNYLIHGNNDQKPEEMFKAIAPLWDFNPSTETAHYVAVEIALPEFEDKVTPVNDTAEPS